MKQETASIRFLYGTAPGRFCLKVLVQPWISKTAGVFLSSGLSKPMISGFIKKNHIDLTAYPQRKYRSFNDFFTRERKNEIDTAPLISPCDAYLSAYPIGEDSVYTIKHACYDLAQLLGDKELATRYAGGTCLIFRLTPSHYHRYCFACNGKISGAKRIDGKLHCVRPIAYTSIPVFTQNSREYVLIQSEQFGNVVQMEVGALLVGKIKNHPVADTVQQGKEKGYFEFGGSTIILLLEKDRVSIDPKLLTIEEKDVRYGQKLTT